MTQTATQIHTTKILGVFSLMISEVQASPSWIQAAIHRHLAKIAWLG